MNRLRLEHLTPKWFSIETINLKIICSCVNLNLFVAQERCSSDILILPDCRIYNICFVRLYKISAGWRECVRVRLTVPPAYPPTCLPPIIYTLNYGNNFRLHFIFWVKRKFVGEVCPTSNLFQVYITPSRVSPVFAETALCKQLVHSLVSVLGFAATLPVV
jgi:hypothetical protein